MMNLEITDMRDDGGDLVGFGVAAPADGDMVQFHEAKAGKPEHYTIAIPLDLLRTLQERVPKETSPKLELVP